MPAQRRRFCRLAALLAITIQLAAPNPSPADAPPVQVDWRQFLSRHDMVWQVIPDKWDDGAFVGNGLLGFMVYREDDHTIRFDVGRSDVADDRPADKAIGQVLYDKARLPIGRIQLKTVGKIQASSMRLDLWNAHVAATITTDRGSIQFKTLAHAVDQALLIDLQATDGERESTFHFVPEVSRSTRGETTNNRGLDKKTYIPNPPSSTTIKDSTGITIQPLFSGGGYATAWDVKPTATGQRLLLTVGYARDREGYVDEARKHLADAIAQAPDAFIQSHERWWHDYYPQSFVSIPDTRVEGFYWIQMYKLASATRADRPALDLMGPWFRRTTWPAIWWNLNIQLTYMPVYTANRLHLGESLTRLLNAHFDTFCKNVPPAMQVDSAGVARVTSYDCAGQMGEEFGNLPWTCQTYWRHYRSTMDDAMLRDHLFPLLKRSINTYLHMLKKGEDGKLHLPPTMSPEYGVAPDCNYDLALLRWGCQTLLWSCQRLQIDDPLIPKWKETLATLVDYPVNDNGFMVGADKPFAMGHRHYSHLFMIYPLHLMDLNNPAQRALAEKSIDHWLSFKGGKTGYTWTGAASMYAALGRGQDAARAINTAIDSSIKRNTMYLEGSPVIETPLSAAESLHELLLQSWGDSIHVFPAIPESWRDVTFHQFRADGAFLVSAARRDGKTQWITIQSLAGEPCLLRCDIAHPRVLSGSAVEIKKLDSGAWSIPLGKGQSITLAAEGVTEAVVTPVASDRSRENYFGFRRRGESTP